MILKIKESREKGCKIFSGKDHYAEFDSWLTKKLISRKSFILTDENTHKHCLPVLFKLFPLLKKSGLINIRPGETYKNLSTCQFIWDSLGKNGADRDSVLICLGGGVVCDMGGFAASLFKRGISFINIPTTLLAMTDASIGGKTGIDYGNLKNVLGIFNPADAVFIHSEFLQTLGKRQIINGWAEVVKHALISDKKLWKKIKKINPDTLKTRDDIIQKSIKIKTDITRKDPLEKDIRKILNFGHTIGHALESYSLLHDKNPLLHGEAVALGMVFESALSCQQNKLSEKEFSDITAYIVSVFPSYKIHKKAVQEIASLMSHDKKNRSGKINFSLLPEIGKCDINCETDRSRAESILLETLPE